MQGCLNGYGERCGNSNLASIIANLELKLGHTTIGPEKLQALTSACRYIAELANLPMRKDQPYVGQSAFAHKGGIHVSAVMKDSSTYEHIAPELVGNRQRVLVSDLSGRSNVTYQLQQHGLAGRLSEQARRDLLERVKEMEFQGYDLEAGRRHFRAFVRQSMHPGMNFFEVRDYYVAISRATATATVAVSTDAGDPHRVRRRQRSHERSRCLRCANAFRRATRRLADVRLTDYKVRVLDSKKGTAAKVRVLVEWSDHHKSWSTVGVSDNVIEASWNALVDALRLELMRLTSRCKLPAVLRDSNEALNKFAVLTGAGFPRRAASLRSAVMAAIGVSIALKTGDSRVRPRTQVRRDLVRRTPPRHRRGPPERRTYGAGRNGKAEVAEFTLITQNVDGLHDLAGSKNVSSCTEISGRAVPEVREVRVDRAELADLPPHCACAGMWGRA